MKRLFVVSLVVGLIAFGCGRNRNNNPVDPVYNPQPIQVVLTATSVPTSTPTITTVPSITQTPTVTPMVVVFPDPNLEAAVRVDIVKPTGPIYNTDLLAMTGLHGQSKGISDLTGLEYAINLQFVELTDNAIVDISALEFMPKLTDISLNSNLIVDVTALVANADGGGIGNSFSCMIGLATNPLSTQATTVDIPHLRTFNITVVAP